MSMSDRDGFIWQDGKLVPWREATTHVLTHSLHYGMGVFEGVRAYKTESGTAIFRLKEHTERLFRSAHIFQMQMPHSIEEINEAQKEVIRANNLESGYLRPLAFYGSEKLGVSPKGAKVHIIIAAWPWGAYLGEDGMQRGIRAAVSRAACRLDKDGGVRERGRACGARRTRAGARCAQRTIPTGRGRRGPAPSTHRTSTRPASGCARGRGSARGAPAAGRTAWRVPPDRASAFSDPSARSGPTARPGLAGAAP